MPSNSSKRMADMDENEWDYQELFSGEEETDGVDIPEEIEELLRTEINFGAGYPRSSTEKRNHITDTNDRKAGQMKLAALLITVCMLGSATFRFGGTYLANSINGYRSSSALQETVTNSNHTYSTTSNYKSDKKLSIEEVVALSKDSVVEITTEVVTTYGRWGQFVSSGAGSGVIVSYDGYIVTNEHVISDARKITVRVNDEEYAAVLVASNMACTGINNFATS